MSTVCEISSCSMEENSMRRISILRPRHFTRLIIIMPCPGSQQKSRRLQKNSENFTEAPKNHPFDHSRNFIDSVTCPSSSTLAPKESSVHTCQLLFRFYAAGMFLFGKHKLTRTWFLAWLLAELLGGDSNVVCRVNYY